MNRFVIFALVVGICLPTAEARAGSHRTTAPGPGGVGVRLADVPLDARNPLAHSYVIERLKPGGAVRRRVEVINTTTSVADVTVYAAAARLRNGAFEFAPGRGKNDLSRWTSVSPALLHLAPGTSAIDTVAINVPADTSAGERYAVVWAAISAPALSGGGVRLVNRVGVRMYVSVGHGGTGAGSFVISGIATRRTVSGEPLLIATITNTGAWTLDLSGTLSLSSGPAGLRAARIPITVRPPLPPGVASQIQIPLDQRLPRGPWRVRLHIQSGTIEQTSSATVTFPAWTIPPATPRRDTPWLLLTLASAGVLALLILAVAGLVTWLTRRASSMSS